MAFGPPPPRPVQRDRADGDGTTRRIRCGARRARAV